jgi:hypothetical protein
MRASCTVVVGHFQKKKKPTVTSLLIALALALHVLMYVFNFPSIEDEDKSALIDDEGLTIPAADARRVFI